MATKRQDGRQVSVSVRGQDGCRISLFKVKMAAGLRIKMAAGVGVTADAKMATTRVSAKMAAGCDVID